MDSLRDQESGLELSSSEDELRNSRNRRNAVHYASIGDFLSSLNISDTALASLQGLKTLSLEHYKNCMQNGEMPPGDMDKMSPDEESPIAMMMEGKGETEQLSNKHDFLERGISTIKSDTLADAKN
ncbi:uncharacterized protein [Drosophila tropicalis]|uniref:uncharacterized protein n=1 Tax=Drosophila tropicalis TaxID=46794 RepID=UPI0035ABE281